MGKRINKYLFIAVIIALLSVLFLINTNAAPSKAIYLKNGGSGDGSSFEQPIGDFKDAVRLLRASGGTIVVCGEYSFGELIALSEISGTANKNKTITVTSLYDGTDYRQTNGAFLCFGKGELSANIILAGNFVFENINIQTAGNSKARAIICGGNTVVFGEGIVCTKNGEAPHVSIVGGNIDEDFKSNYSITIKSGTYNYVCASNRNGIHDGNTLLTIEGGIFEGDVSATGLENENNVQSGDAELIIKNGTFLGKVGALSALDGDFTFDISGGIFKNDVVCLGKTDTVNVNGGDLQNIGKFRIEDLFSKLESEEGSEEENEDLFVVNINVYNGDVKKLVDKIQGEDVNININTEGGIDREPEDTVFQETAPPVEQTEPQESDSVADTEGDTESQPTERKYFFDTRNNTVLAIIVLVAVIFSSSVIFAFRTVHRKK